VWITPLDFLIRVYYTLYMKVINKTGYETKQLRTLFARCLGEVRKREGAREEIKKQEVVIENHIMKRRRWSSSEPKGWVGGYTYDRYRNSLWIKLPKIKRIESDYWTHATHKSELDFSQSIADTYFHEIGHNFGMGHNEKRTMEHLYIDWVKENISNEKFPINYKN